MEAALQIPLEGHVGLSHGEHYKIQVQNPTGERVGAEISIDGTSVGNFLVSARDEITIERPADVAQLFTFFLAGSEEATAALLETVSEDKLGTVSVRIVPEKERPHFDFSKFSGFGATRGGSDFPLSMGGGMSGTRGFSPGGTGLSGASSQKFKTVAFEGDDERAVTINLRLVHDDTRRVAPAVRPLTGRLQRENPVPPPVGGNKPKPPEVPQ